MKLMLSLTVVITLLAFPAIVRCDTLLSSSDLELIELLQSEGIFPPDFDPDDVPPDVMKKSLSYYRMQREGNSLDTDAIKQVTDPKYASPEATWSLHKKSLMKGDLKSAVKCLEPNYAIKFIETYEGFGEKRFKKIAADMRPIKKIRRDDHHAKYGILRKHKDGDTDISYEIYFVNINGNWKIESY